MSIASLPIIAVDELKKLMATTQVILFDARSGPHARQNYVQQHLKSAYWIDLNTDLSNIKENFADGGRHPLPSFDAFISTISKWGILPDSHVVIYDTQNGANAAARFWWMLKAIGHEKVQVLDGGYQSAVQQQFPIESGENIPTSTALYSTKYDTWQLPLVSIKAVKKLVQEKSASIIDVREAKRYNGEYEPIDLVAGHIPTAMNVPYIENLKENGQFKSPDVLKEKYVPFFKSESTHPIIVHCGSGVTACHTILAMKHAGLPIPKLYVGSWSEWSRVYEC